MDWSMFEKEGFAIFQVLDKMDYLFFGEKATHVFTDHRNLLYVFAPLAFEPALGRHVVAKVQRWALFLSQFDYVIEHIDGRENVFADILTRWFKGYRKEKGLQLRTICSLVNTGMQITPSTTDFVWPGMETYRRSQEKSKASTSRLFFDKHERLWKKSERIWIPEDDAELQLKVMAVSLGGEMGHRGQEGTIGILTEYFYWSSMKKDVKHFVRRCLHCFITRTGEVIPRPLGMAMHASRVNEILHMDFLYMGASNEKEKYLLIIRDGLSGYVWLWPAERATSEEACEAVCMWIAAFGGFEWLVSDQGSHFKHRLLEDFARELRSHHHFTTTYSPWSNGSVERICREVLRACRALLSE